MKKFFSDVIAEIREPSEDAGKVLDVIRRVVRLMLFFMALVALIQHVTVFLTNSIFDYGLTNILGLNFGIKGFFGVGFRYVKDLLMLFIYIYLFFAVSKSIKQSRNIESKLFKAMLIALVLLPLLSRILGRYTFSSMIKTTIASTCLAVIIGSAFIAFKENRDNEQTDNRIIRIRNISISGYISLFLSSVPFITSFVLSFKARIEYYDMYFENSAHAGFYDKLIFCSNYVFFLESLILLAILVCAFVLRFKYTTGLKKTSNILLVVFAALSLLLVIAMDGFSYGILSILIFLIAIGYQNKNRAFDEIHKRIFAKIKTGVDNYMHIGRD